MSIEFENGEQPTRKEVIAVWAIFLFQMLGGLYVVYEFSKWLGIEFASPLMILYTLGMGCAGFFYGMAAFYIAIRIVYWKEFHGE